MSHDNEDLALVLLLASSSASLDASPKKNWVENGGGLPPYVRKLARGIMKSGKSKSQAISIAIGRIKAWAAGGDDVDPKTRAKAAKALAQWNALKAKNKSKQVVKATSFEGDYLTLAATDVRTSFDTNRVSRAWHDLQDVARAEFRKSRRESESDEYERYPYLYVQSIWTDFIIVSRDSGTNGSAVLFKIPYVVTDLAVTFGAPELVKVGYEPIESWDSSWDVTLSAEYDETDDDGDLSEIEIALLKNGE